MEQQDHDLLIELRTMVGTVIQQQNAFMTSSTAATTRLAERISALETKDSRDSEKVRAIDANVQQSLKNFERINELENKISVAQTQIDTLGNEVTGLRNKAHLWDIGNSIAAVVAGIVGFIK